MTEIPTVRIKADTPLGYAVINESDFIQGEHELYDQTATAVLDAEADDEDDSANLFDESGATPEGILPDQKPDEPPPEAKSRKRRSSVEDAS